MDKRSKLLLSLNSETPCIILSACTGGQTSNGVDDCACPAADSGQAVDATSGNCQCPVDTQLNDDEDECVGKCDNCCN